MKNIKVEAEEAEEKKRKTPLKLASWCLKFLPYHDIKRLDPMPSNDFP